MFGQMMKLGLTLNSLIDHASKYHSETEIVSIETDNSVRRSNWGDVAKRSRQLASALSNIGCKEGDRCATICWNNLHHLECYYGISCGGMVCHTINPRLFPEQLVYIINNAEDKVLFFDSTFLPIITDIWHELKTVTKFVLMSDSDTDGAELYKIPELVLYESLLSEGNPETEWPEIDEDKASSLCYTSGTTGHPKGVLYSHRSTVLHALVAAQPDVLNLSAQDVVMPVVPMFHVNAWGIPYITAIVGAKVVLPGPSLDGHSLVKLIDEEKVSVALGVPTIWQGLLTALDESGSTVNSLKRTIVGGSACPPSMMSEFRTRYDVEVIHAWGMTETSPIGTANTLLRKHSALTEQEKNTIRESQGRPPYGVQLRIVGDDGRELKENGTTQGSLQIRGHWVVEDYYGIEKKETLEDDGWFETGDVATINRDGYMTIRDRTKDVIKSGGEWISSVELEGIALGNPFVFEAAVIGAAHRRWGERPILLAVINPNSKVTERSLIEYFSGKVSRWQIPDRVIFIDKLPRNGTGKILKNKLRSEYGKILLDGKQE